ncbi:MAG: signal transduction histidine kinase [Alcanivorax sp.]|jgi:signal transduction histidine kinase
MKMREVVTSLTFRYMARYTLGLSTTVFVLLAALYAYFSYDYFSDLSDSILGELETLEMIYRDQSLAGVDKYIDDQLSDQLAGRFSYLVTDAQSHKVAGDLPLAPRYQEFSGGWLGFELALSNWGETVDVDFLARPADLGDGYRAIVAHSYADTARQVSIVFQTLFRAMLATVLLGIAAGYVSAAKMLDRVESLNMDLTRIVRANPAERLDTSQRRGYVRQLAIGVNSVLAQMESLMQGVKLVSDNIAHDLRTPLTRMRNNLSQLAHNLDADKRREVDKIIDECDELLASFNGLLRISALESGALHTGNAEVDLVVLLQDVVELYEPVASEKNIGLKLHLPPTFPYAGDRDLLFQMAANIIDNAIKHTFEGGTISVALHDGGSESCTIVFGDSGPGIAASDRKNVFRRFYRIESSRSEQPGHGLGLSLVQAIAQYHRGSVSLSSNNPGLRVKVNLPVELTPGLNDQ